MSLSDYESRKNAPPTPSRPRREDAVGRWWGDAQKLEAVKTWLMLRSWPMTAAVVKIPEETLKRWGKTQWWKDLRDDLLQEDELQLSARLKKLVDSSLSVVEDRLANGDYVYNQKTGEMRRKPVAMRDAHKVALDMQERHDLILKNNAPKASDEQMADKLMKLANKFAELAGAKKLEAGTIEGTITDVEAKEISPDPVPGELLNGFGESGGEEIVQESGSATS